MHSDAADIALKNLERLIARDPMLRDIVNPSLPNARRQARFTPDVDVLETAEAYVLLIELPGVPRASIDVELEGTRLIVTGAKPTLRPVDSAVRVSERATGAFRREFLLPYQVAQPSIQARLKDGVLRVTCPRIGGKGPQKVKVEGE